MDLFGEDYRDDTLSKLFLAVERIIIQSLKSRIIFNITILTIIDICVEDRPKDGLTLSKVTLDRSWVYQNAGKYQVLSLEAILSTDTGISKPNNILIKVKRVYALHE